MNDTMSVAGIDLCSTSAGMRKRANHDVALIALSEGSTVAALLTNNQFPAAPIEIAQTHLAKTMPRYILINSVYANAGLGQQGIRSALQCCDELASLSKVEREEILMFSTGVIGQPLPVSKLTASFPELLANLNPTAWPSVAEAIMTTDTFPKCKSASLRLRGVEITITGIAKGAGMICPNMATMLAFAATDLGIEQAQLQSLLEEQCAVSLNAISVDGDTSTNDAAVLIATGAKDLNWNDLTSTEQNEFCTALQKIFTHLAYEIVRDGEGSKHVIQIDVVEAENAQQADTLARLIAHSLLVKTAMSVGDPNWGRILAVVGRAPFPIDRKKVQIYFGDILVFADDAINPAYREEDGVKALSGSELNIRVVLGSGSASARLLTSDLTTEYVEINANYRT